MSRFININGRKIGPSEPPYIIAEMSANHNGSIENAFKIIDKAKECGASAVKMQTYTADTITLKSDSDDFKIKGGLWAGQSLYDLYKAHICHGIGISHYLIMLENKILLYLALHLMKLLVELLRRFEGACI